MHVVGIAAAPTPHHVHLVCASARLSDPFGLVLNHVLDLGPGQTASDDHQPQTRLHR